LSTGLQRISNEANLPKKEGYFHFIILLKQLFEKFTSALFKKKANDGIQFVDITN